MTKRIVIVGAGGHGREVLDVIEAINSAAKDVEWDMLGFVDNGHPDEQLLTRRGTRLLGGQEELRGLDDCYFALGIGSSQARRRLDGVARAVGLHPSTLIHPSATIGSEAHIGEGAIVFSHVSVTTNVTLGRHVHLNLNSTVAHDAKLGDYVNVNPGATVSGHVRLGDDVTMGANSTIIQGLTIGPRTVVGAGAVVVRDLPAGVVAVGVPARPISQTSGHPQ